VDEMNANPVDLGPVLREGPLMRVSKRRPVILRRASRATSGLSLLERDALRPVADGFPAPAQPRGRPVGRFEIVDRAFAGH